MKMKDENLKRYVISDDHLDVDWARQRVKINERIDGAPAKPSPAWRWAVATATVVLIAAFTWFGVHQLSAPDKVDTLAELEQEIDDIIDGRLPQPLYVLNGWTDIEINNWESQETPVDQIELIFAPDENGAREETL
jgi:hypothetical protein